MGGIDYLALKGLEANRERLLLAIAAMRSRRSYCVERAHRVGRLSVRARWLAEAEVAEKGVNAARAELVAVEHDLLHSW